MKIIKTPEEVLIENGSLKKIGNEFYLKYGISVNKIMESMKAYAAQLELTDEEIEKRFPIYEKSVLCKSATWYYNEHNNDKQEGAKWYRSQLKELQNSPFQTSPTKLDQLNNSK